MIRLRKSNRDCTVCPSALLAHPVTEYVTSSADLSAQHRPTPPSSLLTIPPPSPAQLVRSIIAAGANPNIATPNAITPVALAAQMGRTRCLAVLLSSGASPHHVVRQSVPTPLQWAIIGLNPTCLAFLLTAGANPEERHKCSSSYFDSKMQECLSKNHKPSSPGAHVIRVLHVAEAYGARSWQWIQEQDGVGVEEPVKRSSGLPGSTPAWPPARASWMVPGRGMFVPAVLR